VGKRSRVDDLVEDEGTGSSELDHEQGTDNSSFSDVDNSLEDSGLGKVVQSNHGLGSQDFAMPNIQAEIPGLEELMSSEMFGPLLRLSPPPSDKDYCFNLDSNEGVCDLFDVL